MAWIYLAESEESLKPWLPGCGQLPTVKSTDTLRQSWFLGWWRAHYLSPQFGTMCGHFTEACSPDILKASTTMENQSTLLRAAFRARTSALRDKEQDWKESEVVYFSRSLDSLAIYDQSSSSWKTCQQSLFEEESKWSASLPAWGMTVDGVLFPVDMALMDSAETVGFCLPRPKARDWKPAGNVAETRRKSPCLPVKCKLLGWISNDQQLSPRFVESLMGYRTGWTGLSHWVMQWFRPRPEKRLKS